MIVTGERFTMREKGETYEACFRGATAHGSESDDVKPVKESILRRIKRAMITRTCVG